ncbi:MAG: ATP-binding protein [Firmicutes bacterium]|nr:ATP-binding protein [Bacillota bacterium]
MRPVFETCIPRPEVLSGELKEDIFAARLRDVMQGTADPVYGDPDIFFENTYPTTGLKELLKEALGRLTGIKPNSSPILRLETSFGGGKTHNLIALYHLVKNKVTNPRVKEFIDPSFIPIEPLSRVAGIVGTDMDVENGINHGEITTYTLWGEIAYQLGGHEAYQVLRESDVNRVAPGTQVWEKIIGDKPALIMIDELARYLRVAKGRVGTTSLAEQTVAFLVTIMEYIASRSHAVLVFTLADSKDAFGKETEEIKQELDEARSVSARQERAITSTGETEISAIVNHRLFKEIDRGAARETAEAYLEYYRSLNQIDLPQRATRAEYQQEMVTDYPFHPELLTTLNRKTATIPKFQKTRGALRLLALVVRRLWEEKPANTTLIHLHHVNLSVPDIVSDLTSRLERQAFSAVVEADIYTPRTGSSSHAAEIDQPLLEAGKPPFARRAATSIFVHSLTQGIATGVDPADLHLAMLQPGDDPTLLEKTLSELEDKCWFLDFDGRRYRFKTEPSLNKIIADEMASIGRAKPKNELNNRIRNIWKKGIFEPQYFPSEAGEVDDDAGKPKLVVIHYDAASINLSDEEPPELVLKIFNHAGSAEGFRRYKNNILFLVADEDHVEQMIKTAQRYLAIRQITSDSDRMNDFSDEQKKKLKSMYETSELDLRVAITKGYRYLYYPSADAPRRAGNLARVQLPAQDQGKIDRDQSKVLLEMLRKLEKVLTEADNPISAPFVKAKAWPANKESVTTEELRKAFAQRLGLRMLLDINQLKKTIREGVKNGTWIYFDATEQIGYSPSSPAPMIQFSEDALLYTPEEAKRLGLQIKGEERDVPICPVCQNPEDQCTCDIGVDPLPPLKAEGAPGQVFQAIADLCHDRGVKVLKSLTINVEGANRETVNDVRSLGLAVPQMGKGIYHIQQDIVAEFSDKGSYNLKFSGGWERYKRLKQVVDAFNQEAEKIAVRMKLRADFSDGLAVPGQQYDSIRDVFTSLGLGKMVLSAEPAGDETKQ